MKIYKYITFLLFTFISVLFFSNDKVYADTVSSESFEIEVGNQGWISAHHVEISDGNNGSVPLGNDTTYYYRYFHVSVNPNLSVDPNLNDNDLPQFKWIHEMCFEVNGIPTSKCEVDELTDYTVEGETKLITTNSSFSTYFFTTDESVLPYYFDGDNSEVVVTFKNTFVCLENCELITDTTQELANVTLTLDEDVPVIDEVNTYLPDNNFQTHGEIEIHVTYTDEKSGLDNTKLKYLWTDSIANKYISDINIDYVNGETIKFFPPHMWYQENAYFRYYFLVLAYDIAGNYTYEVRLYHFFSGSNLIIEGEGSNLLEEGTYDEKVEFNINVANENLNSEEIYYLFTQESHVNIVDINQKYTNNDIITFKPTVNYVSYNNISLTYYFYLIAYDNNGDYFYMVKQYTINILVNEIEIDASSVFPITDDYYKTINLTLILDDERVLEDTLKYVWSMSSSVYNSAIDTPYVAGSSITFSPNFTGTFSYYIFVIGNDNEGNVYQLIRKYNFDLARPVITDATNLDNTLTYKELTVKVNYNDNGSGIDHNKVYFLWTENQINEETYLEINNVYDPVNGSYFTGVDGLWYFYILVYDKVGNYNWGYLSYTFDNTPPIISEEIISENIDTYSASHYVYLDVNDHVSETFNCAWIDKETVVNDKELLINMCSFKTEIYPISNLEGEYYFWYYFEDELGNYSLNHLNDTFLIDTRAPTINFEASEDTNVYLKNNSINLEFEDVSNVNYSTLKYGWFLENYTVSDTSELKNYTSSTPIKISYPDNVYGVYKLWISIEDEHGNNRFLSLDDEFYVDSEVISIVLKGDKNVHILKGQEYVEQGFFAYKGSNPVTGRKVEVTKVGDVNINMVGTYYITYLAGDDDNNVFITRTIMVEESSYYFITITILTSLFFLGYIYQICYRKPKNNIENVEFIEENKQ